MRRLMILLPLALAACSDPPPPAVTETPAAQPAPVTAAPPPPPAQVQPMTPPAAMPGVNASFDGYGATRFGMSEAELRAAHGGTVEGQVQGMGCDLLFADGVGFMFDEGKFARYQAEAVGPVAPGGGQVGFTRDQIAALHPGHAEEPHKYVEGGKNLVVVSGDRKLIFETDAAGIVTKWRIGVPPAIDLVEDCG